MPHSPNQAPNEEPLTDALLTDEERSERDRLVAAVNAATQRSYESDVERGRHLAVLRDQRLYRESGLSWDEFVPAEFGFSGSRARQFIELAKLHDAFVDEGIPPLTVESQARAVASLEDNAERIRVVMRGRELAEAEGVRLAARHLEAARNELTEAPRDEDADVDEAESESTTNTGDAEQSDASSSISSAPNPLDALEGLLVILPRSAATGTIVGEVPGGALVRWSDALPDVWPDMPAQPLSRVDTDEVAEFVWAVLTPGPRKTAKKWTLPDGPFRAVYHPDRLGSPTVSSAGPSSDRATTVLVAPEVDLLRPEIPERIIQEVMAAVGRDLSRRYLFLTAHPDRAGAVTCPVNAFICVAAHDSASVSAATEAIGEVDVNRVLLLRGLTEKIAGGVPDCVSWILVRGADTTRAAYDSVAGARLPDQQIHVGRKVTAALPAGYPALPAIAEPLAPRPRRRAAAVDAGTARSINERAAERAAARGAAQTA